MIIISTWAAYPPPYCPLPGAGKYATSPFYGPPVWLTNLRHLISFSITDCDALIPDNSRSEGSPIIFNRFPIASGIVQELIDPRDKGLITP